MAKTISTLYQRLFHRGSVPITPNVKLDTLILFLQGLPAESFLGIYTNRWGILVLHSLHQEPPWTSRKATLAILAQVVEATMRPWYHQPRVRETLSRALEQLETVPPTLGIGPVLRELSDIGITLASAAPAARTASECLAALLDEIDAAIASTAPANTDQLSILTQIQERGQETRVRNRVDVSTIKSLLTSAESQLAATCLSQLRSRASCLLRELESHPPKGPPLTRLLDNLYGRVWESALNAKLACDMPPKVLEAVRTIEQELADVVKQLSSDVEPLVSQTLLPSLRDKLPPSYVERSARLRKLMILESPKRSDILDLFSQRSFEGHEAVVTFFIAFKLIIWCHEVAPACVSWIAPQNAWYEREIVPMKGTAKFTQDSDNHRLGSGITLAHHPPVDECPPSFRKACNIVLDLDDNRDEGTKSPNILALKHGLGYCSGISGYMFLFARFFLDIKSRKKEFDVPHAILWLLIFMVYVGGHTWNEGLQTINFLENRLQIGILPKDEISDPRTYVSDYERFISIFDYTDTGLWLREGVNHAHMMTILYRRQYFSSNVVGLDKADRPLRGHPNVESITESLFSLAVMWMKDFGPNSSLRYHTALRLSRSHVRQFLT